MFNYLSNAENRFSARQKWIAFGALVALIIIAWPARFYFLNDDLVHIPLSAAGTLGHHNSVRYTGDISLMMDYVLYGKNATGYHITNLLLHLLNAGLFLYMLLGFSKNENPVRLSWLLLYTVLLFAFYAFHSDAIFWVIGRSATLGCAFFQGTILCMQRWKQSSLFRAGFLLCWTLALFSYESVWVLPVMATLAFLFFSKPALQKLRPSPLQIGILWFCFFLYMLLRKWVTGAFLGSYEADAYETLSLDRLLINYGKFILRTFIPPFQHAWLFAFIGAVILWAYILHAFFLMKKKYATPVWIYLHIFWLLSYLPYLSLGISTKTVESERFLYLPSLFFSACLIYSLFLAFAKRQPLFFHILSMGLIGVHFGGFILTADSYAKAGKLVHNTFSELQHKQPFGTLEVKQLPLTFRGIPVFRSGFKEGYAWLVQKETTLVIADSTANTNTNLIPKVSKSGTNGTLHFKEN